MCGYIYAVSPIKFSNKQNQYFDISMQLQNDKTSVRVMSTEATSRKLFVGKCSGKIPVELTGINSSKSMNFFNSNTGSRISDKQNIQFKYKIPTILLPQ